MPTQVRGLLRDFGVNCLIALAATVLFTNWPTHSFARNLWVSFVYSNTIGFLASFGFNRVGPRFWNRPRPVWLLGSAALLLVAGVIGTLLASVFLTTVGTFPRGAYWPAFRYSLWSTLVITMLCGGSAVAYETLRSRLERTTLELRTRELERERALKLASEARLASLESRVHPHFLFNALNSISALIREDPAAAERLVERMAALLRFSLDAGQFGLVPLGQEVTIAVDYLEIERARFGERLRYRVEMDPSLDDWPVPPLMVQSLVENSVKYAVSARREGAEVRIEARAEGDGIRVAVSDDGPGFDAKSLPPGHGLDNLQGRLQALFHGEASLSVGRDGPWTRVRVALPGTANAVPPALAAQDRA